MRMSKLSKYNEGVDRTAVRHSAVVYIPMRPSVIGYRINRLSILQILLFQAEPREAAMRFECLF